MSLSSDLLALDHELKGHLEKGGFDRDRFLELAATLREGDAATRRATRNTVKGTVEAPKADEIGRFPDHDARMTQLGREAMERGELAFCTMAGGMATRMGGIVKALAEVFDGHTFLQMRLSENRHASEQAGRPVPLWLMTSDATDDAIARALKDENAPAHVAHFMQNLSLRLNPDGSLFRDHAGKPSVHATGHGDLVDALRRSGLLEKFVKAGGKYVWITNVDNLGASIDPMVLGRFIDTGKPVQCEVCRKEGDKGGIPARAEGKLQVLEEFRLPKGFDPKTVNVFNTNTFLVKADALLNTPFTWTYFEVEKKVDDLPAIQFERLVQEITAHLDTTYLEVPRDGTKSRFLPVKDFDELAKRRPTIEQVAKARGMV